MTNDNLEQIKSKQVLDMITVANDFCLFTESMEKKDKRDILSYYQKVLPLLFIKGALLPEIKPADNSANVKYVNEEQWQNIFQDLENKFGEEDKYWFPDLNDELMKESLADNIADIYQDMKDFVLLFQDARLAAKENAVADLWNLYQVHWGPRITKAVHKIHLTLFNSTIREEELNF
jgi:DNA primase